MTGLTKATQVAMLDHGTVGLERNLWVALFNGATAGQEPKDDGSLVGTGCSEVATGGYARVAITAATWDPAVAGAPGTATRKDTNGPIVFTSGVGGYGTLTAWGVYDALTAGVLVGSGPLTNSSGSPITVPVAEGETFQFDAANPIRLTVGDPTDT